MSAKRSGSRRGRKPAARVKRPAAGGQPKGPTRTGKAKSAPSGGRAPTKKSPARPAQHAAAQAPSKPRRRGSKVGRTGDGRRVGFAASVRVAEALGARVDVAQAGRQEFRTAKTTAGGVDMLLAAAGRKIGRGVPWARLGDVLAAAGSGHRLRILAYLLEGPATYRGLQKATGLQVGPLYHHIDKLRLAGLMCPKQRDLYTLTRAGRNMVLVAIALGPLLKDRKARPQPGT